jgi:hypothetical protein
MNLNYNKVWESMNELEMVTSKVCSARQILECAIDALESGNREKAESLMYATDEFLQYYLKDFDEKFKVAWSETVVKIKEGEQELFDSVLNEREYYEPTMPPWGHSDMEALSQYKQPLSCDKDDPSPECKGSWTSFWEENYYPEEYKGSTASSVKQDKVVRWRLPVEEAENGDTGEQEYFVTFPDDLLEAANLKEGDEVEWLDRDDGTFILRKVTKPLGGDEC